MNIEITQEHLDLLLEIIRNERDCLQSVLKEMSGCGSSTKIDDEDEFFYEEMEEHEERLELVKDLESHYAYELTATAEVSKGATRTGQ